jgi:hypothetical protein
MHVAGSEKHIVIPFLFYFCWLPGTKRQSSDACRSPEFSSEVRNAWSSTSTPEYVFMA